MADIESIYDSTANLMSKVLTVFGLVVFLGGCSFAESEESGVPSDLLDVLASYARQNQLSMDEVRVELASLTWNAEYSSKGGAGIIASDTYVDVLGSENVILVDGARWTGQQADTVEVVFVVEGRVQPQLSAADANSAVMVMFTPTHIRYFDFDGNRAGKYERAFAEQ